MIISPRQARDKHRASTQKRVAFFAGMPRGYETQVIRPQPLPAPGPAPAPAPHGGDCHAGTCSGMAVDAPDECLGSCRRKMNQCNSTAFAERPAICDPALRTYNTNATCGGPTDWYQFAPWRAPGHAPVFDSW
jgi:hypothetical protein